MDKRSLTERGICTKFILPAIIRHMEAKDYVRTPKQRETMQASLRAVEKKQLPHMLYSDFLIPIPPLAEQHRIVAKVDVLMALCDRLEASLDQTAATRRHPPPPARRAPRRSPRASRHPRTEGGGMMEGNPTP